MTHEMAMAKYGSDKPDLRVKMEFTELTDVMKDVPFKVFSNAANMPGGRVAALLVPGGSAEGSGMPRSEIDAYTQFVGIYRGERNWQCIQCQTISARALPGLQSPIVKNLTDEAIKQILERTGAKNGDLIFFGADKARIVNDSLGALRNKIGYSDFGHAHGLFEDAWKPLWVIDFPMFEYDETEGRWLHAIIRSLHRRTVMRTSLKVIRDVVVQKPTTWF